MEDKEVAPPASPLEGKEKLTLTYDEWDKLPKKVQDLFIMNCSEDKRGSLLINYFELRQAINTSTTLLSEGNYYEAYIYGKWRPIDKDEIQYFKNEKIQVRLCKNVKSVNQEI